MAERLTFFGVYREELRVSVTAKPSDYALRKDETPDAYAERVANLMIDRMKADRNVGGINTETPAYRRTCERLGIGYNRKSMNARILEDIQHAETFNGFSEGL